MDASLSATIGRSQGINSSNSIRLDAMRDAQTLRLLSAIASPDEQQQLGEEGGEESGDIKSANEVDISPSDDSDVEDIDNETAMNTVYNLLSELGDLNRSNRRAAELLAERFSVLQTQVSRAEGLASEGSIRRRSNVSSSQSSMVNNASNTNSGSLAIPNRGDTHQQTTASASSVSESVFHTPPTVLDIQDASSEEYTKSTAEADIQTDITSDDLDGTEGRVRELEDENKALRNDIRLLIGSIKEQQAMAREYETTLAKSLRALRTAAFERHQEISEVQSRYQELLFAEKSLNERLQNENADLKYALSNAAEVIRSTLAIESEASPNEE
ncbi:hypothetical protein GGI12_003330 [Dipsacomyces acuminosporus]|nr:hypothetical protein GGI12_003330 [Dipsacomyces acuminosporus]